MAGCETQRTNSVGSDKCNGAHSTGLLNPPVCFPFASQQVGKEHRTKGARPLPTIRCPSVFRPTGRNKMSALHTLMERVLVAAGWLDGMETDVSAYISGRNMLQQATVGL